jgi:ketol-acid reductoisomerase
MRLPLFEVVYLTDGGVHQIITVQADNEDQAKRIAQSMTGATELYGATCIGMNPRNTPY